MKNKLKRDFNIDEWKTLTFSEKAEVLNHYWNPFKPEIGKKTRNEILSNFKKENEQISKNALAIGYGYFGHYIGAIYVLLKNDKIKVPKKYGDILVNKGTVLKQKDSETYIVNWRDVGGKAEFRIKNE